VTEDDRHPGNHVTRLDTPAASRTVAATWRIHVRGDRAVAEDDVHAILLQVVLEAIDVVGHPVVL
jgi:hypothetical protein